VSVLLTHLSEALRSQLSQLFSYKDTRTLLERLEPEYRRLLDELSPGLISYSGLQSVLKLLLAERVSIRNIELILEAISEIAPFTRRSEAIAEQVRIRLSQQICGDLATDGVLNVLRLGAQWDQFFHENIKRDSKGELVGFDADPDLIEKFLSEVSPIIKAQAAKGQIFAIVTTPEARPYVRMITGRSFNSQAVLSHMEIACGIQLKSLGAIA